MDPGSNLSRRTLLQRGLFLALGAIGMTAAGGLPAEVAAANPGQAAKKLSLVGTDFEYWPADGVPGQAPAHGDRATLTGRLLSRIGGPQIGYFSGESFFVEGPFVGAANDVMLQLHTFSLGDGSISGNGTAGPGESEFAIVGGTGGYAGASGTYTATLSLPEFGGDGSASFKFEFGSALPCREGR